MINLVLCTGKRGENGGAIETEEESGVNISGRVGYDLRRSTVVTSLVTEVG